MDCYNLLDVYKKYNVIEDPETKIEARTLIEKGIPVIGR